MIYLIIAFAIIPFFLFKKNNFSFYAFFLILLILSAFRSVQVGTDLEMYASMFKGVSVYWRGGAEIGYEYYQSFFRSIYNNIHFYLLVTSLTIFGVLYFFIKKTTNYWFFSLVIYYFLSYYYFNLSGLRQSLASIFILLAIYNLSINKIYYFFIYVFIATSFHTTALVVLPLAMIFNKLDINRNLGVSLIVFTFLFGFYDIINLTKSLSLLSNINTTVNLFDMGKYSTYQEYEFEGGVINNNFKIYFALPNTLICILLFIFNVKRDIYFKLFFIGTIITNLFISSLMVYRISYYFTIFIIVVLPNFKPYNKYIKLNRYYLRLGFVFFFLLIFVHETMKKIDYKRTDQSRNDVVPYKTMLNDR